MPANETPRDLVPAISPVGTLRPAENMALTVARAQVSRGEQPGLNTTGLLIWTIERLAGISDWTAE
jgi:hypothetical protein